MKTLKPGMHCIAMIPSHIHEIHGAGFEVTFSCVTVQFLGDIVHEKLQTSVDDAWEVIRDNGEGRAIVASRHLYPIDPDAVEPVETEREVTA